MLERFIEDYAEKGYQVAFRLCGNAEEAKELAQEAFTKLITTWEHYDAAQPLENWFLTILRNLYYDGVRRYDRRHCVPLDAPIGDDGPSFADVLMDHGEEPLLRSLERRESAAAVREALKALSAEHRAILTLGDMEGLAYEELAGALGCPLGTVRSRLFRARAAFKKALLMQGKEVLDP